MDNKTLHRVFGTLAFLMAAITYLMTVQPSVPFWDCGEFSSAATWQQVPHPPGAPLFLMIGRVFQLIIPFGDLGWRVNLAAVFSSAFTILFVYLITVKLIENFRGKGNSFGEALAIYGSGFIAAGAFTFSDTMWFNSVESEVYATTTVFVALIVWLMMIWNEKSSEDGHERYLLLIVYIIGLSTGVHLLSILTIFSIVYVVYVKKYKFTVPSFLLMGIISIVIFYIIYQFVIQMFPAYLAGHSAGRNKAMEYAMEDSVFLQLVIVGSIVGAIFALYKGLTKKIGWLSLASAGFILVVLGYTTYTHILIRSNSNSPMNENEPKNFTRLASYIGREQYGQAPNWPRRYQTDDYFIERYNLKDEKGDYVYGPWNPPSRGEVQKKDGNFASVNEFKDVNTSAELAYMFKYQIDHMFLRYFFWNFVGRKSDVQDAEAAWFSKTPDVEQLNYDSGYKDLFPIRFFAIPFLIGLIGLFFHYYRDNKMAWAMMFMFLTMGVLATLQQNQQDPQPRERDYFYAGAFLIWAIWIGLGSFSLIEWLGKQKITTSMAGGLVLGLVLIVPVNMAVGGWKIHSRAGNYLPFDYSYNILQSVEPNAIMFTNGDNDTFPVWWLQDVAGVRRDVRIANLSLGNTLWYVDQLKNRNPWGSNKVPLSFADDSLKVYDETNPMALSYDFSEARVVEIPVRREILEKYTNDPQILAEGKMKFTFAGRPYTERDGKQINLIRVQDKLILNILQQTKFERPVYFSNTVQPDAWAGLENHFRYEGMAMRICPVIQKKGGGESINVDVMEKCLMNVDNSNNYSKEFKYGFKFRNLNNPSVYFDEVGRRLMTSYRSLYITYAAHNLRELNNPKKAGQILDKMNEMISPTQFPISFDALFRVSKIYEESKNIVQANKFADMGIQNCMEIIRNPSFSPQYLYYEATGRSMGPYNVAAMLYELKKDYKQAKNMMEQFAVYVEQVALSMGKEQDQQVFAVMVRAKSDANKYDIMSVEKEKGTQAAIDYAGTLLAKISNTGKMEDQYLVQMITQEINDLKLKLNPKADSLSMVK